MNNFKQSFFAGLFSVITIGVLTLLTYKTDFGIFLIASFGSSMVLLYGYPESPFAQPKNVFFGHLLTAVVGMIFLYLVPLPLYLILHREIKHMPKKSRTQKKKLVQVYLCQKFFFLQNIGRKYCVQKLSVS